VIGDKLDQLASARGLHGFTLWKCSDHWQANIQTGPNAGWRCMRGATPSEAIQKALDMDYVDDLDVASGIKGAPFTPRSEADFADAAIVDEPGIFD
jgi:hypothetical protein